MNLKEVVKSMCKAYPGGREAMAGALGMTVTQFNNNLYEKNGCRFFEVSELEAMEDISNTSHLAEYFSRRRGALLVDVPHLEELDRVDLFSRAMRTSACARWCCRRVRWQGRRGAAVRDRVASG